jgi:NAD(P)-dependent dehydrogenase (short-subunit alcohol dehydrogenase family)
LKRFLGKTALVTGASRGIGAAVARMLSERGADVVINFRSKEFRAAQVAAQVESPGRRALLAPADLTDAGSVAAMARAVQIVSGDMIEGTITPKLLERASRGLIESRRGQAGVLPTVEEFAAAIVDAAAAAHSPHGHVFFVGCID